MQSLREFDPLSYPCPGTESLLRIRQAFLIAAAWPMDRDALDTAARLLETAQRWLVAQSN